MDITLSPDEWGGANCSLFRVDEAAAEGFRMGRAAGGGFSLTVHPRAADLAWRLRHFVRYENAHGRRVHIDAPGLDAAALLRSEPAASPTIPRYAVHSTLLTYYARILADGCLKSAARLAREGTAREAVGLLPLGEPPDYLDYVMFAPPDGWGSGSELVINSRLRGELCMDPHAAYTPQARMYFDARRIVANGLAVWDGVHFLKVYDTLPLAGYLLATVREEDVTLPAGAAYWTPTLFTQAANEAFYEQIGEGGCPCPT